MLEFKVNPFITLKLEEGITNIYVNDELFNQCKSVLVQQKVDKLEDLLELDSIDELIEAKDQFLETESDPQIIEISEDTRFWVHCSNLQVWFENRYDTRLIHSNLAFPLLKKLTEVGDPIAKKVFKEEIAKRLKFGSYWVQKFLFNEGYVSNLNHNEIINGVLVPEEANAILEIKRLTKQKYKLITSFDNDEFRHEDHDYHLLFTVKNGHVHDLELVLNNSFNSIPEVVKDFKKLETLQILIGTEEKKIVFSVRIEPLKVLKIFTLGHATIPDAFDNFPNLVHLLIREKTRVYTSFERVLDTICKLKDLSWLEIRNVSLKSLPSCIGNLKMLDKLVIINTGLESLPETFYDLEYINQIVLKGNPLKLTPEIKSLERKFEEKVYNFIKERTIKGQNTDFKTLRHAFEVPEYKIHNKLSQLKFASRIYELDDNRETYLAILK